MQPLYKDIINIFNEISNKTNRDILIEIQNFYEYIYENDYIEFEINNAYLTAIKDIVWYNMLLQSEYKFGLNKFDISNSLFQKLDNNIILNKEQREELLLEVTNITQQWSSDWQVAKVYCETESASNSNQIIIHRSNESPRKYNYYKKTTIIDPNNNNIYMNKDVLLCEVSGKLGDYSINNILYNCLSQLIVKLQKNKKIIIKTI